MTSKSIGRLVIIIGLMLAGGAMCLSAELHLVRRHRTYPSCKCGIPESNYQYRTRSRSEIAISQTRLLVRKGTTVIDAAHPIVDLYQLDQPSLTIDHCSISQVAVQLEDNGNWVLSLRADQNRRPAEGEGAPYNPHLYIKRNEFVVRLRCLGNFENEPVEAAPMAGKPVLAELNPEPFWVENGEPKYVRIEGYSELVDDFFRDIDRVEIEFFYREKTDPNP